ncbi:hypothetical protein Tco_1053219 [Tanacetum coccineum]
MKTILYFSGDPIVYSKTFATPTPLNILEGLGFTRQDKNNINVDLYLQNLPSFVLLIFCLVDKEEEEKEEEKAEDDKVTSDQKVSTPPDYELTEEDVNQEDDDTMGEDQEDEENGELHKDLNLNLDRQDAEMTDA